MCGCLSCTPYWRPGPHPGMWPDWKSNLGSQAGTEPHQPGRDFYIIVATSFMLPTVTSSLGWFITYTETKNFE